MSERQSKRPAETDPSNAGKRHQPETIPKPVLPPTKPQHEVFVINDSDDEKESAQKGKPPGNAFSFSVVAKLLHKAEDVPGISSMKITGSIPFPKKVHTPPTAPTSLRAVMLGPVALLSPETVDHLIDAIKSRVAAFTAWDAGKHDKDEKNLEATCQVKAKVLEQEEAATVAEGGANAQTWLREIFDALEKEKVLGGVDIDTNTLIIIMTPEFAFNVRKATPGRVIQISAASPIPAALETKVQDLIYAKLRKYSNQRVLFASSCCAYSHPKDGSAQFLGSNRITVTVSTSTSNQPLIFPKHQPDDIDGWSETEFKPQTANGNNDRMDLSCFGDGTRALGFGTCKDVFTTRKAEQGDVDLFIYPSAGLEATSAIKSTRDFLNNDTSAWSEKPTVAAATPIGYFQPLPKP